MWQYGKICRNCDHFTMDQSDRQGFCEVLRMTVGAQATCPAYKVPDMKPAKECSTCRFFLDRGENDAGLCRQVPVFVERQATDWCGQYRAKS